MKSRYSGEFTTRNATSRRRLFYAVFATMTLFFLSFVFTPETIPSPSSAESGVVPTPSLTFSGSHAISLTVNPGQFGTSDTQNLVVETTNYTGYTMSIAPSTGNSTDLVNTAVNTYTIPSIASTTTLSSFQALSTAAYGLSTDNGTTYLPITNGGELYSTNGATDSTTGGMTIKLGAKAISSTPSGDYTKAFTLTATANAALYNIIFDANAGEDTVTNMPTGAQLSGADVILPFEPAPTRAGYLFLGWDTNQNATTPAYTDGGTIRLPIDPELDQSANTRKLYAIWGCGNGYICYDDNGATSGQGTMKQTVLQSSAYSAGASVMLVAPNYSKTGYGFVGWSTTPVDPVVTNDHTIADIKSQIATLYANSQIYGPNETITMPNPQAPKQLYAVWLPAEKDANNQPVYLQDWAGCSAMSANEVKVLTDNRDNNVYTITKIVNTTNNYSECWMTENLRIDVATVTVTNSNTNHPSSNFKQETNELESALWNTCTTIDSAQCLNQISYKLTNIGGTGTSSPSANSMDASWYSYGGLYNWYTATAGHGTLDKVSTSPALEGDICPSGWSLPTGDSSATSDFNRLITALGNSGYSRPLRAYPVNYIYTGYYSGSSAYVRGTCGYYWSSTAYNDNNSNAIYLCDNNYAGSTNYRKYSGYPVRCLTKPMETFSLAYDANGGDNSSVPSSQSSPAQAANGTYTFIVSNTVPTHSSNDYEFAGWADKYGTEISASQAITGTSTYVASDTDATLYARWINNTCNSSATTIGTGNATDAVCLQDMNADVKAAMATANQNAGSIQQFYLKDGRDNKSYRIALLDDGNVWMTQNLTFGAESNVNNGDSGERLISNYDSDLPAGSTFVLPASSGTFNAAVTYNPINTEVPKLYVDPTRGGYYSFAAAIASDIRYITDTQNITTSICPHGWDLPTRTQYDYLRISANLTSSNAYDDPYSLQKVGYRAGSSGPSSETNVYLRTSTNKNETDAYYSSGAGSSTSSNDKRFGVPVRCIASNGVGSIHYDANGGTGNMTDQIDIEVNQTNVLSNSFVAPANMSFKEWCTNSNGSGTCVNPGDSASAIAAEGQTATLYAIWKNNLTIIYHGNGHTSGTDPQTQSIPSGTSAYLKSSTTFARTNYSLTKWCTGSDGSGTCYNPSSSYAAPSDIAYGASVDLYAQWTPYLTIIYHGNGHTSGTDPQTQTITAGATGTLKSKTIFGKTDYSMGSWNTETNGSGTSYAAGSSFTAPADTQAGDTLDLYAQWFPVVTVVYDANGGDCGNNTTTCMQNVKHTYVDIDDTFDLFASNYSKTDYGFAGWSTDPNATANGSSTIYGPNETIEATASFIANADANKKVTLYAVWVPKDTTYTLQTFAANNRCDTMSANQVIALGDARDSNVYTVGKLADGNCWMMENLRLDTAGTQGSAKEALSQGYNDVFTGLADPETAYFSNSTAANTLNGTKLYSTSNIPAGSRFPRYNNYNTANPGTANYRATNPSATNNVSSANSHTNLNASIYSYGNYYTWPAAIASTNYYGTSNQVVNTTSLCPTGWHLPYGNSNTTVNGGNTKGGFYYLRSQLSATATNTDSSQKLRKYPNNLVYSGYYSGSSASSRGNANSHWTSTVDGSTYSYIYGVASTSVSNTTAYKYTGRPIRCVASNFYTLTVSYGTGVASVLIDNNPVSDGQTVAIAEGTKHVIDMTFDIGYEFNSWTASDITLGSTSTQSTTFTMGNRNASLTANGRIISYSVIYNANNGDCGNNTSTCMQNVRHNSVEIGDTFDLFASNYSRSGYGYAGWSAEQLDPDSATFATDLATAKAAGLVYGPNETIEATIALANKADANKNITLYAIWVAPEQSVTMQTFDPSATAYNDTNKPIGSVIALSDARDTNVYAVAKLADGNWWMVENLRLEAANSRGADNIAKSQGYASGFTGLADAETTDFTSSTTSNSLYSTSIEADKNQITGGDSSYYYARFPRYNNYSTTQPGVTNYRATNPSATNYVTSANSHVSFNASVYSYGNYYTWAAAVADTEEHSSGMVTSTSICPTGWHLPYGNNDTGTYGGNTPGGFPYLDTQLESPDGSHGTGGSQSTYKASQRWRAYPNNFLYTGLYNSNGLNNRGQDGYYWSGTASHDNDSVSLSFGRSTVYPWSTGYKYFGFAVRCVINAPASANNNNNSQQNSQQQSAEPQASPQATPSAAPSVQSMAVSAPANAAPTDAEDQTEEKEDSKATSTAPLGVRKSSDDKTNTSEAVASVSSGSVDESDAFGLIALVGAGVATTSGLLLLAGKRRKDDEDEEET